MRCAAFALFYCAVNERNARTSVLELRSFTFSHDYMSLVGCPVGRGHPISVIGFYIYRAQGVPCVRRQRIKCTVNAAHCNVSKWNTVTTTIYDYYQIAILVRVMVGIGHVCSLITAHTFTCADRSVARSPPKKGGRKLPPHLNRERRNEKLCNILPRPKPSILLQPSWSTREEELPCRQQGLQHMPRPAQGSR